MGHKPTGNPPGHPLLPINWEEVDKYLQAGCSGTQVAAIVGVSPDTLYRRCQEERGASFSVISQEKRAKGDGFLHAKQYSEAMKGDRGMLIWLGKQRLGQRDKQDVKLDEPPTVVVINYGDNPNPKPWQNRSLSECQTKDTDSRASS